MLLPNVVYWNWGTNPQKCWQRWVESFRISASKAIMMLSQENKILTSAISNSLGIVGDQWFLEFRTESLINYLSNTPILQIQSAYRCYAKSLKSRPTLCDPIDGRPPGSPVLGILQARTLEWVAISFSNAWKWKVKVKSLSRVRLLVTPWTAAYQAPPSMGFSRQQYWSGVPLLSPDDSAGLHK